ncbi:MAG: alpha/beta hydrolase [Clostridiales bacterium]|nr:alpha/beta hydrolase [Clostridiales bacterium]
MYRLNLRENAFVEDRTEGVQETLLDMGFDGLAMYYRPELLTERRSAKSRVGVVIMHCDQNYMPLAMGPRLAQQGYRVVACEAKEGGVIEDKFPIVDRAIRFLKAQGAEQVVLMGHSGGATLMTSYQAVAEQGPEIFQGPEKIWKCRCRGPLTPADGVMLIDANYGNGVMALLSLDPAVTEEGSGLRLDGQWDLFDEKNGYRKDGAQYPPAFVRAYRAAQVRRNDRLIAAAQARLEAIESGSGDYLDDEPFVVAGGGQIKPNNRMLPQDLRLLAHTEGAYDLLHGDGSVTHEVVYGVRAPEVDRSFTSLYGMGAGKNTVKGFLSAQAIRASEADFAIGETGVTGVDWDSSYASPIGNVKYITVPMLTMGMTGSYEYLAAEMIYRAAQMADKRIAFVHGATHVFTPNHDAEKVPGEFGNTETALYVYMGQWLERFL